MNAVGSELSLSIVEAARLVGVSPAALRGWEREGLVAPRRGANGYRRYSLAEVGQLREIRRLREVNGLNSAAIRLMLGGARSAASGPTPSARPPEWRARLKRLRAERGLTLRQASTATALSASFISAIERGQANPSVSALARLCAVYGTSIVNLMGGAEGPKRRLVRPSERRVYEGVPGVRLEQLNFGPHQMELHLFTVEPGHESGDPYQHEGDEFIFLLAGSLQVWLDDLESYVMAPGDVLYFESTCRHRWRSLGQEAAVFLGVNTPATF